jgi:hypothetical protein
MDSRAGRLAGDQYPGFPGNREDGARLVRERRPDRIVAAEAAGTRLARKVFEFHTGASLTMHAAQALALGRDDTASYQRRTFVKSSGSGIRAGFMKSMAISPVMSAME